MFHLFPAFCSHQQGERGQNYIYFLKKGLIHKTLSIDLKLCFETKPSWGLGNLVFHPGLGMVEQREKQTAPSRSTYFVFIMPLRRC